MSGISPEKRLLDKNRDLRAPSFLQSGIRPSNALSMKLIDRRKRRGVRESTSMSPERLRFSSCRPQISPLKQSTPRQFSLLPEQGLVEGSQEARAREAVMPLGPETREFLKLMRASAELSTDDESRSLPDDDGAAHACDENNNIPMKMIKRGRDDDDEEDTKKDDVINGAATFSRRLPGCTTAGPPAACMPIIIINNRYDGGKLEGMF